MSQQHPWGAPKHNQSTRLAPISTAFTQEARNTPSPSASRAAYSPAAASFPSLPAASSRLVGSRKSSVASSTSAPFSPAGQQLPASQLLSSRSRTIAPNNAVSQLAFSAAAAASQGSGTQSSSGGGASTLVRASPSLSASSTVGSPGTSTNPAPGTSTKNLSRIIAAQISLVLSQVGPPKDDESHESRTKRDMKIEQLRKVRQLPHLRLNLIALY
ncbi:hypothetical protein GQ44DRAFT_183885 [Phaeosphaeriaceae sp. PMI808]|nr:hypothetical protein GQ44DRAFT_183885 [Phaeosphaeriaceae sp. PMI808]